MIHQHQSFNSAWYDADDTDIESIMAILNSFSPKTRSPRENNRNDAQLIKNKPLKDAHFTRCTHMHKEAYKIKNLIKNKRNQLKFNNQNRMGQPLTEIACMVIGSDQATFYKATLNF
jgi:hypothetical protein